MRKILVAVALILGAFAGAVACKAAATPTVVSGTASDHSHIVSFSEFSRVVTGAGQPSTNLEQAYADATDTCNQVMTARWQDRPQLLALVPASIQDPILRGQVYSAVLGSLTSGRPHVCVA